MKSLLALGLTLLTVQQLVSMTGLAKVGPKGPTHLAPQAGSGVRKARKRRGHT